MSAWSSIRSVTVHWLVRAERSAQELWKTLWKSSRFRPRMPAESRLRPVCTTLVRSFESPALPSPRSGQALRLAPPDVARYRRNSPRSHGDDDPVEVNATLYFQNAC